MSLLPPPPGLNIWESRQLELNIALSVTWGRILAGRCFTLRREEAFQSWLLVG